MVNITRLRFQRKHNRNPPYEKHKLSFKRDWNSMSLLTWSISINTATVLSNYPSLVRLLSKIFYHTYQFLLEWCSIYVGSLDIETHGVTFVSCCVLQLVTDHFKSGIGQQSFVVFRNSTWLRPTHGDWHASMQGVTSSERGKYSTRTVLSMYVGRALSTFDQVTSTSSAPLISPTIS